MLSSSGGSILSEEQSCVLLATSPLLLFLILSPLLSQLALGVIASWTRTVYKLFSLLAGKSAPHEFLQLIIYKAVTFSEEIEKIDTVRAYHVSLLLCLIRRAHTH